ncbi:hypothetical protein [Psychrobacter sp. JCM 18900]|uniref:hypothetical protein n=1 Tax=Psychrobacter sp. JCM 18900 TaxID=1298608 RepID=UPI000434D037|nr:hypothetical protein [Psychrobacter sp. JCM 18900]GAF53311.1 hypothetical protein JCM18900_11876 [Psychrobacter sp. JCM 18900]
MSDEKEDAGTDFDGKLARIIDQKSRKRNNNDIYERFINRVHGSEENDQAAFETLESAKNLAAFEPLSTEELQLFEDQSSEQELLLETEDATAENIPSKASNTSTLFENVSENHVLNIANDSDSISIDVNDVSSDTEASEYIERNNIDSSNQAESPSTIDHSESIINQVSDDSLNIENVSESVIEEPVIDNKVIKSKKSLMMAMVIGSVVLVAIALMLVFSGVLSTSAVDSIDNSTDSNVETDSTPTVSAKPELSTDSQTATDDVDPVSTQPATTQQDTLDNNRQDLPAANESESTSEDPTPEIDATVIATEEAAITYEDFRQESQTTLYRETND